jgi:hypothetical protein
MLTLQQKKGIYGILLQNFEREVDIPLSSVSLYLQSKNIDYAKFGYKKLKSLLNDLEFLSLKMVGEKDHQNAFVVIHEFSNDNKTSSLPLKNEKKKNKKESKSKNLDKNKVLKLLHAKFEVNVEYPVSVVTQYLIDNNIHYKEFGFKKIKDFLLALGNEVEVYNNKDNNIIYFRFVLKKEEKKEKISYPIINKNNFLIPDNQLFSLKEWTGLTIENNAFFQQFLEDYNNAKKNDKITLKNDTYIFPLSFKTKSNEGLLCAFKKASGSLPYDYYSNYIGSDKEKPKDSLKNAIAFEDYDKCIQDLALLAKHENWCYQHSPDNYIILKIYLQYTYFRLENQNKIAYDKQSNFACFNTGLKTDDYEDIYAVLLKNKNKKIEQKYLFQGFAVPGSQGLGKIIVEHFNPLPTPATYLNSKDDCFYDTKCELHIDSYHIIIDNLDRFPLDFLSTMVAPFPTEKKILTSIAACKNDYQRDKLYQKLRHHVEKNLILYTLLKTSLELTIEKAKRMIAYDYRMALPSYFPTRNVISMMLPLEFVTGKGIHAVLLVEKTASGNYQGQTILTAKQSYVNARLIGPLNNTYLDPSKIED